MEEDCSKGHCKQVLYRRFYKMFLNDLRDQDQDQDQDQERADCG